MSVGRDHWAAAPRTRFFLLSVALHAALLLAWGERVTLALPAAPGGAGALSVQTVTHERAEPPAPAEPDRQSTRQAEAPHREGASSSAPPRAREHSGPRAPEAVTAAAADERRAAIASRRQAEPRDSTDEAEKAGTSESEAAAAEERGSGESGAPPRPAGASAAGAPGRADARNRVRADIRDSLARHFDYPRSARRRGWEGRVVLRLTVHTDGRIDDVAVTESSGYAVLDRSATRALRRVSRLPAGRRPSEPVADLRIPVVYRLEG